MNVGAGGLAEWSIATALKAVRPLKGLGGSNPSPAAMFCTCAPCRFSACLDNPFFFLALTEVAVILPPAVQNFDKTSAEP